MVKFFILVFLFVSLFSQQYTQNNDSLYVDEPLKSPTLALFLSIGVPGAGQYYNEDYWKIGVLVPTFSYFLYLVVNSQKNISRLDRSIQEKQERLNHSELLNTERRTLEQSVRQEQSQRDVYRETRSVSFWRLGLVYLINILDAYISSYLFGFDQIMNEDEGKLQKINFVTNPEKKALSIRITFNF